MMIWWYSWKFEKNVVIIDLKKLWNFPKRKYIYIFFCWTKCYLEQNINNIIQPFIHIFFSVQNAILMMIETLKSFKYETKQTCRERAWMNGLKKRKKWRRWCSLVDDNGDDDEHCYHHYTQPEKKTTTTRSNENRNRKRKRCLKKWQSKFVFIRCCCCCCRHSQYALMIALCLWFSS